MHAIDLLDAPARHQAVLDHGLAARPCLLRRLEHDDGGAIEVLPEGHAIAPGEWAVPLAALPSLSIILPAGEHGQSDVAISLINIDGGGLASRDKLPVGLSRTQASG